MGAWQFPPGWLFACIQGRIHALVLLNLMSLIWSAPSLVTKSGIFSLLKGEEARHISPPPIFFLHPTMFLKLWEGVESNTQNTVSQLSSHFDDCLCRTN